jgi:hypothetical protein
MLQPNYPFEKTLPTLRVPKCFGSDFFPTEIGLGWHVVQESVNWILYLCFDTKCGSVWAKTRKDSLEAVKSRILTSLRTPQNISLGAFRIKGSYRVYHAVMVIDFRGNPPMFWSLYCLIGFSPLPVLENSAGVALFARMVADASYGLYCGYYTCMSAVCVCKFVCFAYERVLVPSNLEWWYIVRIWLHITQPPITTAGVRPTQIARTLHALRLIRICLLYRAHWYGHYALMS